MRWFLVGLAMPTVFTVVAMGVWEGNPLAQGMAWGFGSFIACVAALVTRPTKPKPRRADSARIAALERELGIEPPEHWSDSIRPEAVPNEYARRMAEWGGNVNVVDSEAPTTIEERLDEVGRKLRSVEETLIASEARKVRGIQ